MNFATSLANRIAASSPELYSAVKFSSAPPIRVDTPENQDPFIKEIYSLRYQVYCRECGFLPFERYTDQLEMDEYDKQSVYFSAINFSNELLGGARLVIGDDVQQFPMTSSCETFPEFKHPNNALAAEISRLIIKPTLRRRESDNLQGMGRRDIFRTHVKDMGNVYSGNQLLLFSLYRAMYRYSKRMGIKYWYSAIETSLALSLQDSGFNFTPIGPETDFYGKVTPFITNLMDLENSLNRLNPHLAQWMIRDAYSL